MRSDYREVWAEVYFLSSEEGGRCFPVDLSEPDSSLYRPLADFGFGDTEDGFPIRCAAQVMLDEPGFIEPGVKRTLRVAFQCPEDTVRPGAHFELGEGPRKVVARGRVVSIIE